MGANLNTSFALAGLAAPLGILGTDVVQADIERKFSLSGTALATKEGQAPRLPLPFYLPVPKTQSGPVAKRRNKHALACALSFHTLSARDGCTSG
jgi:hypothetical protein